MFIVKAIARSSKMSFSVVFFSLDNRSYPLPKGFFEPTTGRLRILVLLDKKGAMIGIIAT